MKECISHHNACDCREFMLAQRIEELEAALRFYADPKNWDDGDNSPPTDHDCGWIARRALGEDK